MEATPKGINSHAIHIYRIIPTTPKMFASPIKLANANANKGAAIVSPKNILPAILIFFITPTPFYLGLKSAFS